MAVDSLFDIIGFSSCTIILILGVLLAFISVPEGEQWGEFRRMKLSLTSAYLILSLLGVVDHIIDPGGGAAKLSQLEVSAVLFIAAFQALLFTATNLTFVRSSIVTPLNISINALAIIIVGMALFSSLGSEWFEPIRYVACAIYFGQLCYYTLIFNKELKICIRRLEEYYDDDMQTRLNWIRNCYYSALVVGFAALLCVALPISKIYYIVFVILYTIYYAYILGKVYHYRLGAKFIVNIPATKESKSKIETLALEATDKQCADLKRKLDQWQEQKKYLEKDVAMDEIVEALGVSRRFLSAYFTEQYQTTFRKWRKELRLQEAARLLVEEDRVKINYLYDRVGFASEANFYREFRIMFGSTPTNYRAKGRGEISPKHWHDKSARLS